MFKFSFLIFVVLNFTFSISQAQKARPKSATFALIENKNFDQVMYESGPVSTVVTSIIMGCAMVGDAVNYACYYGDKLLNSPEKKPEKKGFQGFGGGSFGGGGAGGSWDEDEPKPTKPSEKKVLPIILAEKECEWDLTQIPRIVFAPGCSGKGTRICRGAVICKNKKRLATCSENFCTPGTATECAKQKGYSSKVVAEKAMTQN